MFRDRQKLTCQKHHTLVTKSKTNSNKLNNTDRNLLARMRIMRGLPLTIQPWLNPGYLPICILSYPIYWNNSQGRLFLFSHKKGAII